MKKASFVSLLITLCIFAFSLSAKAQIIPDTITVYGPDTVCVGSDYQYYPDSTLLTPGGQWWTINSNGNILGSWYFTVQVRWGSVGNGQLIFRLNDVNGNVVYIGIKDVYVLPLPQPVITTNFKVECQKLGKNDTTSYNGFDTSKCLKVCSANCITYYAKGLAGSTYNWKAVGGSVSYQNADSCIVCWGNSGVGSITAEETDRFGCTGKRTYCVEIIESPIAHFVTLPDTTLRSVNICDSTELTFLDKSYAPSSSPIVSYHWDFGDGKYSSAKGSLSAPVTHMYTKPGDYTVTLTVTNKCGCSTTETLDVHVDPNIRLKIECPRVVCEGDTGVYSVTTGCTTGTWMVIGGTVVASTPTAVMVKWAPADPSGIGYVIFDATSCGIPCSYSTVKVPVVLKTGTIEGPTTLCPNRNYIFKLPQWPTTAFSWSLNSGVMAYLSATDQPNEIVINTASAETITLSCSYTNTLLGCSGSASLVIDVLDPVVLAGPAKVCHNTSASYTITGTGSSTGSWELTYPDLSVQTGSGAGITKFFDQVGSYILKVTGSFCPPEPMIITVDSLPHPPDLVDGPDTFCKGIPVRFAGQNELNGTIFNWTMDNGRVNAGSGKETFVSMNPASAGPFIIYLWRETMDAPFCHSDTITKQVYPPVVNPTITGNTTPCLSTQYRYRSTYEAGEHYQWRIYPESAGSVRSGDGTNAVMVLWNNTPISNIKLVCKMRKCFTDYYDTLTVNLGAPPSVAYTGPASICGDDSFTVSVTNASAEFDFDDGLGFHSNGTGSYRYAYNGNLDMVATLKINVTTTCGQKYQYLPAPTITVNPTPLGTVTPVFGTGCGTVSTLLSYTHLLTNPALTPFTYQWYYNGSAISGATASTYTATAFGYYILEVTSAAPDLCTWTSDTVWVVENCPCSFTTVGIPTATITSGTVTDCDDVNFTASYTGSSFQYAYWEFLSPHIQLGSSSYTTANATATMPGTYTIRYTAVFLDDNGAPCKFYDTRTVTVNYVPILNYTFTCAASGASREVILRAGTFVYYGINHEFYVDNVLVQNDTFQQWNGYLTPGAHTAKLRSSYGGDTCETNISFTVEWIDAQFTFSRDSTCEKEAAVEFLNGTTGATHGYTSLWDFGDLTSNTQRDPARVYDQPSPTAPGYPVKLIVTDPFGCRDSISKNAPVVRDNIEGSLTSLPHHLCVPGGITLTYSPATGSGFTGYPSLYTWYRDRSVAGVTVYQPWVIGAETGMWWLHGEDQYGCVTNTNADTTEVTKVPRPYISGKQHECVGVDYTLNGYAGSDPNFNYQWLRNGTAIGGATNALLMQNMTTPGSYTYRLVISVFSTGASTWCTDTSQPFTVIVHAKPAKPYPSFSILNCNKYEIELTAAHISGATETFNWNNGLSGSPVYTYAGGPYQLVFTDQFGCKSDSDFYIPKDPREYLWIFPTGCWSICPPQPYLIVGPVTDFAQWDYLKNGASVFSGSNSVPNSYTNLSADAPGIFNLKLDNGTCAATSDDMIVDVNCTPVTWASKPGRQLNAASIQRLLRPGLDIVPNPAGNGTKIVYTFTDMDAEKWVEVYDMTGRLMSHAEVKSLQGSVELMLARYVPGVYQVVLRQNGQAIVNRRMTVIK